MSSLGRRGQISEVLRREGELVVEWIIPRFLHLEVSGSLDYYQSPPFPLAGALWHLGVQPDWGGEVYLNLFRDASGPSSITAQVSAGLKGSGQRRELEREFRKDGGWCLIRAPCLRGELSERGLLPGGAITLTCHMRATGTTGVSSNHQGASVRSCVEYEQQNAPTAGSRPSDKQDSSTQTDSDLEVPHEVKQSSEKQGAEKVTEDLGKLLASGQRSDVTVQVQQTEFRVHSIILAARSPVLSAMLEHDTEERSSRRIRIEDSEPDVFEQYLRYLYTGSVRSLSHETAFGLYRVADQYLADDLKQLCLEHVRDTLCVQSFCDTVKLALTHGESDLLQRAIRFATQNFQSIVVSVEWQQFICEYPREANEILVKCFGPQR